MAAEYETSKTVVEINGQVFEVEPPVTLPAGGMLLYAPDYAQFGVYGEGGRLLMRYVRVGDGYLGTESAL